MASAEGGRALNSALEGLVTDTQVVVHSTVLLSVVDHYTRVAKGTNKRVVGTLLGEYSEGRIHVTNSFGVPFEEDARDSTVWFLDHNYHQQMYHMFRKVNRKERVVGWYSTGPKVKPADLDIHEVFRRYCTQPVCVIVDVRAQPDAGPPTDAYFSKEEPAPDRTFRRTFVHIPSTIGAHEAEEVGVEHLLRDLKNASTSTLATKVGEKLSGLRSLLAKLGELEEYLQAVIAGTLPPNPTILYNLQNIFNLLPDLDRNDLVTSFCLKTNDAVLSLYLGSVVRCIITLHNLINNKLETKAIQEKSSEQSKEKKEKEKAEKDKAEKDKAAADAKKTDDQ